MGLTHVKVTVRPSEKSRKKYTARFLVDTGATDCMAPASALQRAGVRRRAKKSYELADGSVVEYDLGFAEVEFMDETVPARVIFGPEDTEPILGVTALEMAGFVVDPASRRLRRLPALYLK